MDEMEIFKFKEAQVRTVIQNDEPWFVAKDVCEFFGDTNYRRSIGRIDEDEKGVSQIATHGGVQSMSIINEAGLYSLLFQLQPQKGVQLSEEDRNEKVEKLREFKRWITHEVLPSIRATGSYSQIPKTYAEALRACADVIEKNEALKLESAQQQQIIHELQPKATYYDLCLPNKTLLSVTKIAKDYGMSGNALNNLLHELGVQYKQGDIWLLYQKHADKGYTQSKTHVIDSDRSAFHTYWTQSGRLFIYELLKQKKEILPLIEREAGLKLVGAGV